MSNLRELAVNAIKDCLGDELSPVLLAQAYAELRMECERQLELCMNSLTEDETNE